MNTAQTAIYTNQLTWYCKEHGRWHIMGTVRHHNRTSWRHFFERTWCRHVGCISVLPWYRSRHLRERTSRTHSGFEIQRGRHQKSKTWYQWPPTRTCPSKIKKDLPDIPYIIQNAIKVHEVTSTTTYKCVIKLYWSPNSCTSSPPSHARKVLLCCINFSGKTVLPFVTCNIFVHAPQKSPRPFGPVLPSES